MGSGCSSGYYVSILRHFNYPPASKQYSWNGGSAYAIPPNPPASTSTITGEPIFTQSYINAYNTVFNQSNRNYQKALNNYYDFIYSDVNNFLYLERLDRVKNIIVFHNHNLLLYITYKMMQVYILELLIYLFQQVLEADLDLCT